MSEETKKTRQWHQKKRYIIPIVLFGLIILVFGAGGDTSTVANETSGEPNNSQRSTNPKEGDVVSGIGRKEIEDKHSQELKLSKLKADQYLESLKGEEVVWIARVDNVDSLFGETYINMKMGVYTVRVDNPALQWAEELVKGDVVKVSGTIKSVTEFIGMTVSIDATTIEKI